MKYIATSMKDQGIKALDYSSFGHIVAGIIIYLITIWITKNIFISWLAVVYSSILWEFLENTIMIPIKPSKKPDSVLNSLCDTGLMIGGGIIGYFVNGWDKYLWIVIIGGLFIAYIITQILTRWKKNEN